MTKTFEIRFYGKKYNLCLYKAHYSYGNGLYIGVIDYDSKENFADLTINIPNVLLGVNEIVLNADYTKEIIDKLVELQILEITDKFCNSGYATYKIAKFNMIKAEKYIMKEDELC